MAEIDLKVIRKSLWGLFEKVGEAIIHEFQQQNWEARVSVPTCPQVLYDVGVPDTTYKLALLLEALQVSSFPGVDKDWVEQLGRTWELVTLGSVD